MPTPGVGGVVPAPDMVTNGSHPFLVALICGRRNRGQPAFQGIAYGYNNITQVEPGCAVYGKQQPVNKLSDQLRAVVAQAGFSEILTFALVSGLRAPHFYRFCYDHTRPVSGDRSVSSLVSGGSARLTFLGCLPPRSSVRKRMDLRTCAERMMAKRRSSSTTRRRLILRR